MIIILFTSFENAKTKVENESAEIATETGLVRAIDSDNERIIGVVSMLNLNGVVFVVAGHPHHRNQTDRCLANAEIYLQCIVGSTSAFAKTQECDVAGY